MFAETLIMLALAASPPPSAAKPAAPAPASAPATAQPSLEDYCKSRTCRHDVDITLHDATGKPMRMQRKLMPPAVEPDMVNVLPGEKVEFVAVFKDGKFSSWRRPTPKDGAETYRISIELKQNAKDPGMVATIRNSGPKALKLTMGLVRVEPNSKPEGTATCPVNSKATGSQTWPYSVGNLLVRDARILAPDEKVACE